MPRLNDEGTYHPPANGPRPKLAHPADEIRYGTLAHLGRRHSVGHFPTLTAGGRNMARYRVPTKTFTRPGYPPQFPPTANEACSGRPDAEDRTAQGEMP